jgi:AcrR family transcriptional regulator
MNSKIEERGRFRQRQRTREQIVQATMYLLKTKTEPTINDIAEAAEVSRRTIYMHFPTLEQLLLDAKLGLLSQRSVDEAIEAADRGGDAEARVTAMIGAISAMSRETLPLGRSLIRLTVEGDRNEPGAPRRGFRRVGWIEKALEPLRAQLPRVGFERLVSALSMVIGWEAIIVLEDIRGLSGQEQQKASLWAARALIRAAVEEAKRK